MVRARAHTTTHIGRPYDLVPRERVCEVDAVFVGPDSTPPILAWYWIIPHHPPIAPASRKTHVEPGGSSPRPEHPQPAACPVALSSPLPPLLTSSSSRWSADVDQKRSIKFRNPLNRCPIIDDGHDRCAWRPGSHARSGCVGADRSARRRRAVPRRKGLPLPAAISPGISMTDLQWNNGQLFFLF